jgi:hypothetical protein
MSRLEDRQPIQVPEALAKKLGYSVTQVRKIVKDGKIRTFKEGKHRYAMPEAVEEYLDTVLEKSLPGIFSGEVL